jgi:hypothetical protein
LRRPEHFPSPFVKWKDDHALAKIARGRNSKPETQLLLHPPKQPSFAQGKNNNEV